jgi:hypothetical protein
MKILYAFILMLYANTAIAQAVVDCDWQVAMPSIVEPWEENSRVFANGKVRLTLVDASEPAAGSFHIVVLSPPEDEIGGRQCKVVSASEYVGFSYVDFKKLKAVYDARVGLVFVIPVRVYNGQNDVFEPKKVAFSLNQATGEMMVSYP